MASGAEISEETSAEISAEISEEIRVETGAAGVRGADADSAAADEVCRKPSTIRRGRKGNHGIMGRR